MSVHSAHLTGENAAELENHSWNGFGEGNRILEYAKDVLVETLTTDQNGKAVLNDLPLQNNDSAYIFSPFPDTVPINGPTISSPVSGPSYIGDKFKEKTA